jgi:hypothetical protein
LSGLGCVIIPVTTLVHISLVVNSLQSSAAGNWPLVIALGSGLSGGLSTLICAALAIVFLRVSWLGPVVRKQREELSHLRSEVEELRRSVSAENRERGHPG